MRRGYFLPPPPSVLKKILYPELRIHYEINSIYHSFPGCTSGKEPTCQCRRCLRQGIFPWVGKIPWRRAWQPTPVFLPGESPWTEEPGGLQSIGLQRVRHDWSDLPRSVKHLILFYFILIATPHSNMRKPRHREVTSFASGSQSWQWRNWALNSKAKGS